MIDSITRITLNLQESNTMVSVKAKRSDTGRKLLIHLSDGSIPYHTATNAMPPLPPRRLTGPRSTTLVQSRTM